MGRGLSQQQREIIALAKAFNAARNGGTPKMMTFDDHLRPGDVFSAKPGRVACAEQAWAPALPDYHVGFGFWVLCGFRSRWVVYGKHWDADTVCRKRRVSMNRAVDGLLARGMFCIAMYPEWVLYNCRTDGVLQGYGNNKGSAYGGFAWESVRDTAPERLREFWKHAADAAPAYWLTEKGFDAAGDLWTKFNPSEIVEAHAESREPHRYGGRSYALFDYATPEAEAAARRELDAMGARLKAACGA